MKLHAILDLAGIPVKVEYIGTQIKPFFDRNEVFAEPLISVGVTQEEIDGERALFPDADAAAAQLNVITEKVSSALLPYGMLIFHGVAFEWRGKAWIFTAPSGTGKTTQYVLWKLLYGEEIQMINGDKPILERRDGVTWVHSSPWCGKENMHRSVSAPLGGIIYLRQDKKNAIRRMSPGEYAGPLFMQTMLWLSTPEEIRSAAGLLTELLDGIPVYYLENLGDRQSAGLTHDRLLRDLEGV